MNKKVGVLLFLLSGLLFLIILVNSVYAVDVPDILGIGDVEKGTELLKDIEGQRTDFLLEEWQKLFLSNPAISTFDRIMQVFNPVFIFLFSSQYSFSLTLLIAILIWLASFLSLVGYFGGMPFIKEKWQQYLAAFALNVAIAHAQLFNYLAGIVMKIIFQPIKWYWQVLIFVVVIVTLVGFYMVNRIFARHFSALKEKREKEELKERVGKAEAVAKGIEKGLK